MKYYNHPKIWYYWLQVKKPRQHKKVKAFSKAFLEVFQLINFNWMVLSTLVYWCFPSDLSLFLSPLAHDCCEVVLVTLCSATQTTSGDSEDSASYPWWVVPLAEHRFSFVQDLAFDMAQFLVSSHFISRYSILYSKRAKWQEIQSFFFLLP